MTEFHDQDLRVSSFSNVDLSGSRFRNIDLSDVVLRGVWARELEIDGDVGRLVLNEVDVVPLWTAEMTRRHPEFALLKPETADGYREVWPILERLWTETVARARRLPEAALHERVEGEYSFIETLRHLLFATDAWVRRALLGEASPYDPLGLPHDEMEPTEGVPCDRSARPLLEEVLALRADRQATMRGVVADLTDERLAGHTEPVLEPGYPESESFPVSRCLRCIVNEEWWHRRFAERDLAVLESQLVGSTP